MPPAMWSKRPGGWTLPGASSSHCWAVTTISLLAPGLPGRKSHTSLKKAHWLAVEGEKHTLGSVPAGADGNTATPPKSTTAVPNAVSV